MIIDDLKTALRSGECRLRNVDSSGLHYYHSELPLRIDIPLGDIEDATFSNVERPGILMKWIKKSLEASL